jgi:hypothetical protein
MIVVDLDNVFSEPISDTLFDNCFHSNIDWNGVFANQSGRYYDIWALRNKDIDFDCLYEKRIQEFQRIIPANGELLPVRSAFGGLGVYKVSCLEAGMCYDGVNYTTSEQCEHLSLNLRINKLFIDTSMVLKSSVLSSFLQY